MKLGCRPRVADPRTIRYSTVAAPPTGWSPPDSYSWFDEHQGAVKVPMYANDRFGCCVIALRAHHSLRFEFLDVGAAPSISDEEVTSEYFRESGGQDSGLVMLYSLRDWRNRGWLAGGHNLRCHAFLEVVAQDHAQVREAMIAGTGLEFGVQLPISASDQMNAGAPWDVTGGARSVKGSWGGHAILADAYTPEGVVFTTWGKRQLATWRWVDAYADECYFIVDERNTTAVDAGRLADALAEAQAA